MKKMCRHMMEEWLAEVCSEGDYQRPSFPAQISEVLAITLENEVWSGLAARIHTHTHTHSMHARTHARTHTHTHTQHAHTLDMTYFHLHVVTNEDCDS